MSCAYRAELGDRIECGILQSPFVPLANPACPCHSCERYQATRPIIPEDQSTYPPNLRALWLIRQPQGTTIPQPATSGPNPDLCDHMVRSIPGACCSQRQFECEKHGIVDRKTCRECRDFLPF